MKSISFILFVCYCATLTSQNVTVKLLDEHTKQPIAYANIKTGEYTGVISNDEGFFTISTKNDTKPITISCMGYENKTLTIKEIKALNYVIELTEAINQLDEVFISTKAPNADTIIAKVKAKLTDNYNFKLQQYHIFKRTTDRVDFKSLEFEIDKASNVKKKQLESVNNSLTALGNQIKQSNMVQFADFKGIVFTLDKDSIKLKVEKATELLDAKNNFSIDNVQEKMQTIILTYLDTTKTYKLKTGLFKIEDSLALNDSNFKDDDKNEYKVSHLNNDTKSLLKHAQFYDAAFLNKILDNNLYEYNVEDVGYNNGELTYVIAFIPRKGKAKYTGKLYIAEDTYAITRVDYSYYNNRRGQKFNLKLLLGIKYIENVSEGTLIFEKDNTSLYHPKYIKRVSGSYFYVSRPLKFIENSSERHKVAFEFTLEGNNNTKEELLITTTKKLTFLDFQAERQVEKTPVTKLSTYQKTIWDNEGVLEPSLEMKTFDSGD
ncbi:carboxypeptidase-like regulatory domain-containing protein [Hyunsoonleella pacifica]|uniref:Carboxypeptidase-like regulatory domain-containing protein n=1 Tax=Hyunsoonleella pacifica TaxID=1080224 RepID=A0A4Q9FQ87_9FLAO|nr:carboxypeptidase-like regulatory domain-containing protein [Hyunsoonleella pacifica]TBN17413.1 carboxypeptidase-like regulatory domain-containing protein [Hyunsoonleella pacifica]GGD12149.1 hypothetical protein GCM10011368_12700 [Hyunsoonleella pacifica]